MQEIDESDLAGRVWFFRGVRAMISIPAIILCAAFIGFAGLARASGISLGETLLMVGLIWALPSVVVLTGAIASGMGLVPTAIAVALASVRLMPMTMALVPILREHDGRTARWKLFLASHFVAVTAWVYSMIHLPHMPRAARFPFYIGFASSISFFVFCMTGISYVLVGTMPDIVSASLLMLPPIYFICSLWGASKAASDKAGMIVGLALGPVFHIYAPGFDLLWTGLVGGTLAYALTRAGKAVRS